LSPLCLVVACNQDWVIGVRGEMPWHIPEDLRHFKRVTMDHCILMGRKTHTSIGRALPGRHNIVITRQPDAQFEGCHVAHSLEEAMDTARAQGDPCPRIIGGGQIYAQALPLATEIHLTQIQVKAEGDTFFPKLNWEEWETIHTRPGRKEGVQFLHLKRI
jgi:dihydrofolate reductase